MHVTTQAAAPLLTYFNVRGRAEAIRLMLEEVAVPYTERRIAVEEWPALKPTLPFGQLPCYEHGALRIFQSHAIYRHLARTHDLYETAHRSLSGFTAASCDTHCCHGTVWW